MRTSLIVIALLSIVACGGSSPSEPDPPPLALNVGMNLDGNGQPQFSPRFVEIARGGTITWQVPATSPAQHNITSDTNAWPASGDLDPSDVFAVTFPQVGAFNYRCTIHPTMVGTVTVL